MSVQVPEPSYAGLVDLAELLDLTLQQLLRNLVQEALDRHHRGQGGSAGSREGVEGVDAVDALPVIEALREERGRETSRWEAVMEAIDALARGQRQDAREQAEILMDNIYALRDKVDRVPKTGEAEWADLKAALSRLEQNLGQLQARVDRALESHTPPAPDETRRGRRNPFRGGGG